MERERRSDGEREKRWWWWWWLGNTDPSHQTNTHTHTGMSSSTGWSQIVEEAEAKDRMMRARAQKAGWAQVIFESIVVLAGAMIFAYVWRG